MAAPLPSPTAAQDQQQYFPSMDASALQQQMAWSAAQREDAYRRQQEYEQQRQQQAYAAQQYQQQQAYAAQQQQQAYAAQQAQPNGRVDGYAYRPDRSSSGATAQETARYISDYGLVAEAAKRAQMAVLMRDLEGVDLR